MMMIKSLDEPSKMRYSCQHDEDVEDLMAGAPNVMLSRSEAFRHTTLDILVWYWRLILGTHCIYCSPSDVQDALQDKPRKANEQSHLLDTV